MKPPRDITKRQFDAALKRYGMKPAGFMGYVEIDITGHRIGVCKLNAGYNRRAQLAYLIKQRDKWETKIRQEEETAEYLYIDDLEEILKEMRA